MPTEGSYEQNGCRSACCLSVAFGPAPLAAADHLAAAMQGANGTPDWLAGLFGPLKGLIEALDPFKRV